MGHVVGEVLWISVKRISLKAIAKKTSLQDEIEVVHSKTVDQQSYDVDAEILQVESIVRPEVEEHITCRSFHQLDLSLVVLVSVGSQVLQQTLAFPVLEVLGQLPWDVVNSGQDEERPGDPTVEEQVSSTLLVLNIRVREAYVDVVEADLRLSVEV